MGTTSTSGWGVCLFLLGFTILGTAAVGGGFVSLVGGVVVLGLACVLFQSAKAKES